jgi:thymidylate synthase (FAD)
MKILNLIKKTINPHGFIKVIDISPRVIPEKYYDNLKCDYAITEAARVSYSNGTKKILDDESLIKYLYSHEHTTPFEMVTFKFHIKAPLFVVRQWQRHRCSTYNEISGRYSILPDSFWYPEVFRKQCNINKQGSVSVINNLELKQEYLKHTNESHKLYMKYLSMDVSREMARTILPLNIYTEFYWKIDLHNLLRFIRLRSDLHAQEEIRLYSNELKEIVKEYCPVTMEAFENFTLNSMKFSKEELLVLKTKSEPNKIIKSKSGIIEFNEKIKKLMDYS